MKRSFLIVITLLLIQISIADAQVNYSAPEFMQAYYQAYSRNYINTLASGRGNTGVAKIENIENVLLNPAGFSTDHSEMYIEFMVKPEQKEIGHLYDQNYHSNKPFTFVGFGFNIIDKLSTGLYYSLPNSIKYDRYTIDDYGTALIQNSKPEYNQYSFGLVNSYKLGKLSLGFNAKYDIHSIKSMLLNGSSAKFDLDESLVSFSTGAIYQVSDRLNFGLAYNHSSEIDFTTQYYSWDVTIPASFSAGISYYYLYDSIVNLDYEKRFNSQMSDYYDDLDIFKLGLEQQIRNSIVRFGLMYIPSTFSGQVNLPIANLDSQIEPHYPNNFNNGIENILSTEQTFLTIGYTLNMEELTFNLSGMQAVGSEMKTTQLSMSIGVNLTDFDITKYTPKSRDED
jgi:hypothetical protein